GDDFKIGLADDAFRDHSRGAHALHVAGLEDFFDTETNSLDRLQIRTTHLYPHWSPHTCLEHDESRSDGCEFRRRGQPWEFAHGVRDGVPDVVVGLNLGPPVAVGAAIFLKYQFA